MRLTHPTGVVFGIAIASTAAAAQPPARGHAGPPRREIVYLTPDINGGSGPTEIRRVEIREDGPEQIEEATIRRPDINGTWSVNERTVTRRLEGAGREESVIDTYDRGADGFVRFDGRLAVSQRVRVSTRATADGGRETVEEVENRSPVAPHDGLQMIRRTVETVRNVGLDRWVTDRQVFERDLNGRLVLVTTEREESSAK